MFCNIIWCQFRSLCNLSSYRGVGFWKIFMFFYRQSRPEFSGSRPTHSINSKFIKLLLLERFSGQPGAGPVATVDLRMQNIERANSRELCACIVVLVGVTLHPGSFDCPLQDFFARRYLVIFHFQSGVQFDHGHYTGTPKNQEKLTPQAQCARVRMWLCT